MEVCGGEDICTGGGRSRGYYKEMLEIHHQPSPPPSGVFSFTS